MTCYIYMYMFALSCIPNHNQESQNPERPWISFVLVLFSVLSLAASAAVITLTLTKLYEVTKKTEVVSGKLLGI